MSTFKNSRPPNLKIARPTSLRPAAEPLSNSTKDLLKEARTLTESTAAAHGKDKLIDCPSFLVREQSEVAESQGFQVLEIVRAIGRADAAPAANVKEQKVKMAKALHSYVIDSPGVCENFFTAVEETTPFEAVLEVIKETESGSLASTMIDVLVTIVLQVGLGLDMLRKMLGMLIEEGQLPRCAYLLLKGMTRMANEQHLPSIVESSPHLRDCPSPGTRAAVRRRVAQFFVFDGSKGGLCLGREEAWTWTGGYAFETWLWWEDEGVEGEPVHVFRMVGENGKGGAPRFAVDLLVVGGFLQLQTQQGNACVLFRAPVPVPARRWVHVVMSQARNGLLRRSEADLWVDGQHAGQHVPYPQDKAGGPVSLFAGCGDWDHRSAAALFKASDSDKGVAVRRFCGLMDRVRLFGHALSGAEALALAEGDVAAAGVTKTAWSCAQPGGVLPLAKNEGEERPGSRKHGGLQRTNALRKAGAEAMGGRRGAAMLGTLRVGGRMGLCEALECEGQADALVVLLAAALCLPAHSQLEEPSTASPALQSPAAPLSPQCPSPSSRRSRRGSGGGAAGGRVAGATLHMLATVMKKGAGMGGRVKCGSLGVGRVLGATWFVLHKAGSEVMTGDVLVGVLALVDACWTVERQAEQHGGGERQRQVMGRAAASWLLGSEVWVGRAGEVVGLVVKELRNMSAREPGLMQEVWGLTGMLDVMRDLLWGHPRTGSAALAELGRQRERGGGGLSEGEKEWLREAVAEACKYMCGRNSAQGGFGAEEWQSVWRFAASCREEALCEVVLGLAAEEQVGGAGKAVGAEEWVGVMLGVLGRARKAGTWCTGLSLLVGRLGAASRSEVESFVRGGGWQVVGEALEGLELTEAEANEVYNMLLEMLLSSNKAGQPGALVPPPLSRTPRSGSFHGLTAAASARAESLAMAQYIDSEQESVLSSHVLALLLSFLVTRSAVLRQRGINDLVLLLGRTPKNALALLQVPSWAEVLVALIGTLEHPPPAPAPAPPSLPSVVTWFTPHWTDPDPSAVGWQASKLFMRDAVTGEEDMDALLGLWQKLVAKLISAIVLKKEGWKDLKHLLSAVARAPMPERHRELAAEEAVLRAACGELAAAVAGAERWDGPSGAGVSMGIVRDNVGGLLGCVLEEALRRRGVSWSRELVWEGMLKEARNAGECGRGALYRRLLELADSCFSKPGSPGMGQVELKALCGNRREEAGEVGPAVWPHALWCLSLASMVGEGWEGAGVRGHCERLLRCVMQAPEGDSVAAARARATVEVLREWVVEAKPEEEAVRESSAEVSSSPKVDASRKRRLSAEYWFGIVGGRAGEAEEALQQGSLVEAMAVTARLLAGKVPGMPDMSQGGKGRTEAVRAIKDEAVERALKAAGERESARAAVRGLEGELGSGVRWRERAEEEATEIEMQERRDRGREAEARAREAEEVAREAEERRRAQGTGRSQGRVSYGRRCWKKLVKAQVHERSVWGRVDGVERVLVGERVAGLLGSAWKHCWVQGPHRLRRRLKRNPQAASHADHAYHQPDNPPPPSAFPQPIPEPESDSSAGPLRPRAGSLSLYGVKARERPERHDGDDGADEEEADATLLAGLRRDVANNESSDSLGWSESGSRLGSSRTIGALDNLESASFGGSFRGDPLDMQKVGDSGSSLSSVADKLAKEGGGKVAGAEEMLDWGGGAGTVRSNRGRDVGGEWECELVAAGGVVHGRLQLTPEAISFEPEGSREDWQNNEPEVVEEMLRHSRRWRVQDILEVHGRRYMLKWTAVEIFFSSGRSAFLNLPGDAARAHDSPVAGFYRRLVSLRGDSLRIHYLTNAARALGRYKLTEDWVHRRISNLEYLMHLNLFAGRTYNDLTQYPVMPWVLADYSSASIDLSNPHVYRDLSKPIAAQSPDRISDIQERYDGWCDPEIPPFHYGSHYSTAGWVLWYLLRTEPYTTSAVHMQGGRFDCPDRLFWSIADAYHGVTTSTNDVKELIPEFFFLPDFLLNSNDLDLGKPQLRGQVDNVELPPWAEGSASTFVRVNRLALESEHVSNNLHHWIDLIFGHKQQGAAAVEALNVFFYLTYEERVDLEAIPDPVLRRATEAQIANFGQTPCQLFAHPHPRRKACKEVVRAAFDLSLHSLDPDGPLHPPFPPPPPNTTPETPYMPAELAPPMSPMPPSPMQETVVAAAKQLQPPPVVPRFRTCQSMPVTPMQRPQAPDMEVRERSRSIEPLPRSPTAASGRAGSKGVLGEVVVRGVAGHKSGGGSAVCFLASSGERLTAVTETGGILSWGLAARPSEGLPVTLTPVETQPGQAGGGGGKGGRGMLGGVATALLGQGGGGGGGGEARGGGIQDMEGGAGRRQGFAVVERGGGRALLTGGHAGGVVQSYGVDGQGGVGLGQEVAMHQDVVTCMCLAGSWESPRGGLRLVTGSRDCTARVWGLGRAASGRGLGAGLAGRGRGLRERTLPVTPEAILHGHQGGVQCVGADCELDVVVSGGGAGECLVHSLSKGRYIRALPHPDRRPVAALQLSREGEVYMVGEGEAEVHAVDINGVGARVGGGEEGHGAVVSMVLSNDGALLFTAHENGQVVARSAVSLAICTTFPPLPSDHGLPRVLETSKCGNLLLVGSDRGKVAAYTSDTAMHNNIHFLLQHIGLVG